MSDYAHLFKVSDSGSASDQFIPSFSTAEKCYAVSQVKAAEENRACSCFEVRNLLCVNNSSTCHLQSKGRNLASFVPDSGKDFVENLLEKLITTKH